MIRLPEGINQNLVFRGGVSLYIGIAHYNNYPHSTHVCHYNNYPHSTHVCMAYSWKVLFGICGFQPQIEPRHTRQVSLLLDQSPTTILDILQQVWTIIVVANGLTMAVRYSTRGLVFVCDCTIESV